MPRSIKLLSINLLFGVLSMKLGIIILFLFSMNLFSQPLNDPQAWRGITDQVMGRRGILSRRRRHPRGRRLGVPRRVGGGVLRAQRQRS